MAQAENTYPVAVINSNEDIVESIRLILEDAGILSISGHAVDFKKGRADLTAFLKTYNPQVILYDIAPPYEENWQFFQLVKDAQQAQERQFVLTTTNKGALERLVGQTDAIEIIGKPFDLDEIVTAVKKKLQA
jgi:DNA-binding NtrC family response regulator